VGCGVAVGAADCSGLFDEPVKGTAEPKLLEKISTHAIKPIRSAAKECFISSRPLSSKQCLDKSAFVKLI
jgi:hypothetical protein